MNWEEAFNLSKEQYAGWMPGELQEVSEEETKEAEEELTVYKLDDNDPLKQVANQIKEKKEELKTRLTKSQQQND